MRKDWVSGDKKNFLTCTSWQFLCYKHSRGWSQTTSLKHWTWSWEEICIVSTLGWQEELHTPLLTFCMAQKMEAQFTSLAYLSEWKDSWIIAYLLGFPLWSCFRLFLPSWQYVLKGGVILYTCLIYFLAQNFFLMQRAVEGTY